ncbi:MAG: Eco57I restriction-modification methylase domain-containing protein [Methanobacteriaceae archaeon]
MLSSREEVLSQLENIRADLLEKVIFNDNILNTFINDNLKEKDINYLLLKKDENSIVFNVHILIIGILLEKILHKQGYGGEEYGKYFFSTGSSKLCSFFEGIDIEKYFFNLGEDEILDLLELFHIEFLNSTFYLKNSLIMKKMDSSGFKQRGAVYTPLNIVNEITYNTIDRKLTTGFKKEDLKILDFGCGTGRFYISAIKYLYGKGMNIKEIVSNNVFAMDIDKIAIDILKMKVLNLTEDFDISILESLSDNVCHKNMLLDQNPTLSNLNGQDNLFSNVSFNIVLSNPPYFSLKVNSKGNDLNLRKYMEDLKGKIKKEVSYFRESSFYNYSTEGVLNYYKLSIEKILHLSSPDAEIGIICPSTLFADITSKKLRKFLLKSNTIHEINYFPEKTKIFENITQATIIFYLKKGGITDKIYFRNGDESFHIPLSLVEKSFKNNYEIPFIDKVGWSILKKLSKFRKIKDMMEIRNKRGELDLYAHKDCITFENTGWHLIRGKMIKKDKINRKNSEFVDIDKFASKKSKEFLKNDFSKKRLICHQISNMNTSKRLNFVFSNEKDVISNSCNYIQSTETNLKKLDLILNSYLINWRFKISSSNNHINNYEIDEFPVLDLSCLEFDEQNVLISNISICKFYGLNKVEMNYILRDFFKGDEINKCWEELE